MATFLRDDPSTRYDYCSNVTGIDWPAKPAPKTAPPAPPSSSALDVGRSTLDVGRCGEAAPPPPPPPPDAGHLEAVYHLYSIARKTTAPVILRLRTANRTDATTVPSLTPVWRSCELQEREIFDLYGIHFEGHPDLRRLLMWDEFKDHPMRKDYISPDDYEWEPTPHDEVLTRAKTHYPQTTTEATA
ncbi:NADH-quinone oxidoreductase subunit C [Opitutaceae bacterium TAV4]|nr:NADH-quinone oxidoreductase subunit C [Opitutaceae bacterium TAV4]